MINKMQTLIYEGRPIIESMNHLFNKDQRSLVKYNRISFDDLVKGTLSKSIFICNEYFRILFNENFIETI